MMNIRTLKLTNLGRFEELDVHLAPVEEFKSNVTVLLVIMVQVKHQY